MISVIVPIYNAQKYLRECLDSLANQTYKDLEVLMVNDGSTDESEAICREYENKYENFRLINKENGGQMSAWKLGMREAKGEFLGFMDSDDKADPEMFEELAKRQAETNADLVHCGRFNLDTRGAVPFVPKYKPFYGEGEMDEILRVVFPTMTSAFSQSRWDKLFRKDLYIELADKYADYNARTFEDRFIVGPYVFSCKSMAFVDKPLYYWRAIKGSSSRKPRPELCDIMENLYSRQVKMLKDKGLYERYRGAVEVGKIDIMRSIIERNLGAPIPQKDKRAVARTLLTEENRRIVTSHKDACVGKFGKYLYTVCKLNSPFLMVTLASLFIRLRKNTADYGFEK